MRYMNLSVGIENWDGRPVVSVSSTPADGLPAPDPALLVFLEYRPENAHVAVQVAYHLWHALDRLNGGAIEHGLADDTLPFQQATTALLAILWTMHRRGQQTMPGYTVNLHGMLRDLRSLSHYAGQAMVGNPVVMDDLVEDYERSVAV